MRSTEPGGLEVNAKTALLHDWFQGMYGSERVVEALFSGLFPPESRPDVYTFQSLDERLPAELAERIVKRSRLSTLPGLRGGRWRYLLPYMPAYFRNLPLEDYELVIASSHSVAVQARVHPRTPYVCYCHTPMRYAWLQELDRRGKSKDLWLRALAPWLRRVDRKAAQRPTSYVANSETVRQRIKLFYGRDATVINPPVDVSEFRPTAPSDPGHFLWVHRLVDYKRPLQVAEAFRRLPYRLTMVGIGSLRAELEAIAPPNVTVRGWLSRSDLVRLYEDAAGFIHVGEEDFGITMVEALAAGTPVIALNRGGAAEIVRDGTDGVLVEAPDVGTLESAIDRVATTTWEPSELARRAVGFSRERFLAAFRSHLAGLGV